MYAKTETTQRRSAWTMHANDSIFTKQSIFLRGHESGREKERYMGSCRGRKRKREMM